MTSLRLLAALALVSLLVPAASGAEGVPVEPRTIGRAEDPVNLWVEIPWLMSGWRFREAHSPDWAEPDLDDSGWQTLDAERQLWEAPPESCDGIVGVQDFPIAGAADQHGDRRSFGQLQEGGPIGGLGHDISIAGRVRMVGSGRGLNTTEGAGDACGGRQAKVFRTSCWIDCSSE